MSKNRCVCHSNQFPFYCPRHCMTKKKVDHDRCNGLLDYKGKFWNIFERGEYAGQGCKPNDSLFQKLFRRVRKRKGCDCAKRKAWLNSKVPGLGTAVEWFTKITGIKRQIDRWYQTNGT